MHNHSIYLNPRMDYSGQVGSAEDGTVKLDITKLVWIISMLLLGTIGSAIHFSWSGFALFVFFTGFTLCFGHSLGMHRRFIHRSYNCPKWLEVFFVHLGTIVGIAGPIGMLTTHDFRDWAQRQPVCHPYFGHDNPWFKDLVWQVFCKIDLVKPPVILIEPEIANDLIYLWMEKHWMWQQLPWAVLFYLLGGWSWVCWGIASRVLISVLGHWVIGYFAHNTGHRDWHVSGAAVQGHNIKWAALLTMGECWHNNHHAFPYSAKLGIENNQFDPGWAMLLFLKKLGLATALIEPENKFKRTDLISLR